MTSFSHRFLTDTAKILDRVDVDRVELLVRTLRTVRNHAGRVFFAGTGGGAGHASHAACDFRKLAGIEAYSVSDNVSELTARVNDASWDTAYVDWLRASRLRASDCVFVFSVGGGSIEPAVSVNLVEVMRHTLTVGAALVGIAGRDGGMLGRLADVCVLVPTGDPSLITPQTEGMQALLWHLIVTHPLLAESAGRWETLDT